MLGTFAVISVLASFVRSPLEEAANALVTPNPAKAPWYFLWLQEIVTDTTFTIGGFTVNGAFLGGVILPGLLLGLLTAWPWLDRSPADAAGVWFARQPAAAERRLPRSPCWSSSCSRSSAPFLRGPSWQLYWPWQAWPELPTRI